MKLQFFPLLLVACAQAAPRSSDARAAISHRQGSNITGEVSCLFATAHMENTKFWTGLLLHWLRFLRRLSGYGGLMGV